MLLALRSLWDALEVGSGAIPASGAAVQKPAVALSGGATPSGTTRLVVMLRLGGAITPAGVTRQTGQLQLRGSATPSGAIIDRVTIHPSGTITPVGSIRDTILKLLAGGITPTGADKLTAIPQLRGSMTSSGRIIDTVTLHAAGSVTSAGSIRDTAMTHLAGALTPSGSDRLTIVEHLAGAMTPTGADRLTAIGQLRGSIASAGAIVDRVTLHASGAMTPTGTDAMRATVHLTGALTLTGTDRLTVVKRLAGSITPSGTVQKRATLHETGSITPSGTDRLTPTRHLTGSLASAGSLRDTPKLRLGGSVTPTGAARMQPAKRLAGTAASSGALRDTVTKRLSGSITPAGVVRKTPTLHLAGSCASSGALATHVVFHAFFTGTLSMAGGVRLTPELQLAGAVSAPTVGQIVRVRTSDGLPATGGGLSMSFGDVFGGLTVSFGTANADILVALEGILGVGNVVMIGTTTLDVDGEFTFQLAGDLVRDSLDVAIVADSLAPVGGAIDVTPVVPAAMSSTLGKDVSLHLDGALAGMPQAIQFYVASTDHVPLTSGHYQFVIDGAPTPLIQFDATAAQFVAAMETVLGVGNIVALTTQTLDVDGLIATQFAGALADSDHIPTLAYGDLSPEILAIGLSTSFVPFVPAGIDGRVVKQTEISMGGAIDSTAALVASRIVALALSGSIAAAGAETLTPKIGLDGGMRPSVFDPNVFDPNVFDTVDRRLRGDESGVTIPGSTTTIYIYGPALAPRRKRKQERPPVEPPPKKPEPIIRQALMGGRIRPYGLLIPSVIPGGTDEPSPIDTSAVPISSTPVTPPEPVYIQPPVVSEPVPEPHVYSVELAGAIAPRGRVVVRRERGPDPNRQNEDVLIGEMDADLAVLIR